MPSASSKSEKLALMEAPDPLKQAIVIVEHKIRNLEKKKNKLDSYKKCIQSLTKEQIEAVSKYDQIVQQLELSKEYMKQFSAISTERDKLRKKQEKKDAKENCIEEINKIKQVLEMQDVLQNVKIEMARQDLLTGQNGATQLTEADLKALDDLYVEISPKRLSDNGTPLGNDQFLKAAEVIFTVIKGEATEVAGSTGIKLRDLITSIQNCGYFNKVSMKKKPVLTKNVETPDNEEEFQESKEILSKVFLPTRNSTEGNNSYVHSPRFVQPIMPRAKILPGAQPGLMQTNTQHILPPSITNVLPTPVSQVESNFFNVQGFKPPVPPSIPPSNQNSRQINDMIQSVAGKFNFLQQSELEIADLNSVMFTENSSLPPPQMSGVVPTIPSQTFTNQNFNSLLSNLPPYPPNYSSQQAAFPAFVPAFPAFVQPNTHIIPNANTNPNSCNLVKGASVNNLTNPNISSAESVTNASNNKCNSISAPIPIRTNSNPNIGFHPGQQQTSTSYPGRKDKQNSSQVMGQSAFSRDNITVVSGEAKKIEDAGRVESEAKEKQENSKQDWSQTEGANWNNDWTETTEWNSMNANQSGENVSNSFSGRSSRNADKILRNNSNYQGNRNRTNKPGGYRDSQGKQGNGPNNYYHNQNNYQARNDRNNDYLAGKGGNLKGSTLKAHGDYINRDQDNYSGGLKRGPCSQVLNIKNSLDQGDKSQMQSPRNNAEDPRIPRNDNRQSGGRGSSFQR